MIELTEVQWRAQVVDLAAALGWRTYFTENATREITRKRSLERIRVSTVNRQGVGFPDLVLVRRRDHRLIFAELKRGKHQADHGQYAVTPAQHEWLDDLEAVARAVDDLIASSGAVSTHPFLEVHVWRPRDIDEIERTLR